MEPNLNRCLSKIAYSNAAALNLMRWKCVSITHSKRFWILDVFVAIKNRISHRTRRTYWFAFTKLIIKMFNNFCFLFTQYVTKIQQVINITFFFIAALNKRQVFFFYQGFLSRILTTHRTAEEGNGPSYSTLPHLTSTLG